MTNAINLRKHLHRNPELSGFEAKTSNFIAESLKKFGITKIHRHFSQHSLLVEIDSEEAGKTVLFRCELDALPIEEENGFEHRSTRKGIAHLCGHDGHSASMFRFAQKLVEKRPKKGKILLFFQSAEETGTGAKAAIESGIFDAFAIDYAFAFHNIPSFALGTILLKNGLFTPRVESAVFELIGKTSHASQPQKGQNPAFAIAKIINYLQTITCFDKGNPDFFITTPIHIEMGEKAYGVSAGKATIGYTFRTWENTQFEAFKRQIMSKIEAIAHQQDILLNSTWLEIFYANNNHEEAYQYAKNAAIKQQMPVIELEKPFEFGEDFGLFTEKYKGAMFGIGSGENQAPLHNPTFDFPDELIEVASTLFYQIVEEIAQ